MKAEKVSWFKMISVGLVLCGMLLLPQAAALAGGKSFSADQVTITPDGKEITGKIYVHGDKFRMEMEQPGMPGKMIVLYSKEDKAVTMLMMMSKRYFVIPADESQYASYDPEEAAQKKKLGTETVNGFKCTKYEVVNEVKGMIGRQPEGQVDCLEIGRPFGPGQIPDRKGDPGAAQYQGRQRSGQNVQDSGRV